MDDERAANSNLHMAQQKQLIPRESLRVFVSALQQRRGKKEKMNEVKIRTLRRKVTIKSFTGPRLTVVRHVCLQLRSKLLPTFIVGNCRPTRGAERRRIINETAVLRLVNKKEAKA